MKITPISVIAFLGLFLLFGSGISIGAAAAAVNPPQIERDLYIGATGIDVANLQQYLNNAGYTVSITGPGSAGRESMVFGNATKNALARFQAARGIAATGIFDNNTRILFSGTNEGMVSANSLAAKIEALKKQIISLQQQLAALLNNSNSSNNTNRDTAGPRITSIVVSDGGSRGYIDTGDTIRITFDEAVKPASINTNLDEGSSVYGVLSSDIGGVNISSSGILTIKGIASFAAGTVGGSGSFSSRMNLSASGKVLTVTITSGSVKVNSESFAAASQIGGTVEDLGGNKMANNASIGDPGGTFGANGSSNGNDTPEITAIKISNEGSKGFIDNGDVIKLTFNKAIDPKSINAGLSLGGTVTGIASSQIGGVNVSSSGSVSISGIAAFAAGSVASSGIFISKLSLDPSGAILTITLSGGSDIAITGESFGGASQVGGAIKDLNGNNMASAANVAVPTGTFGGNSRDSEPPYIASISVYDGGNENYIDPGDAIEITFSEAIDPDSINGNLQNGSYVSGVPSTNIGGVSVSAAGLVAVNKILTFGTGTVRKAGTFNSKISLDSAGKILTIKITSGTDIEITAQNFNGTSQVGGTVADVSGNQMQTASNITSPAGNF